MDLEIHKKTGLYYRPGTQDLILIKEMEHKEYKILWERCKDEIVLDLGGYIGDSSLYALNNGAKQVISLEPSPNNLEIFKLQKHINNPKLIILEEAVSNENGIAKFYITKENKATGSHSLKNVRGREEYTVKTRNWKELLDRYNPTIIKMDCEGGEDNIDFSLIGDNVKAIMCELHPKFCKRKFERTDEIIATLKEKFKIVYYKETLFFNKIDTILITGIRE
jgi:FkbM family methyltransferase